MNNTRLPPRHTHLPPHRQVLEDLSVTHFNEDMYLDDTCTLQFPHYHARDSCVCVSVTADTDTGCVLVTADDLGVVCWWMFDGDSDGNRAQCLRPVSMSQSCRLPGTRVLAVLALQIISQHCCALVTSIICILGSSCV